MNAFTYVEKHKVASFTFDRTRSCCAIYRSGVMQGYVIKLVLYQITTLCSLWSEISKREQIINAHGWDHRCQLTAFHLLLNYSSLSFNHLPAFHCRIPMLFGLLGNSIEMLRGQWQETVRVNSYCWHRFKGTSLSVCNIFVFDKMYCACRRMQ